MEKEDTHGQGGTAVSEQTVLEVVENLQALLWGRIGEVLAEEGEDAGRAVHGG